MFVNSNKSVTISLAENGGFIVSYYAAVTNNPNNMVPPSFSMKNLIATTEQELSDSVIKVVRELNAISQV